MDPKPIEFWRERIEKNPGSVRLKTSLGFVFVPFYFVDDMAYGKDGLGAHCDCNISETLWTEDWPKHADQHCFDENELWNIESLAKEFGVSPQDVIDARNCGAVSYADFETLLGGRVKDKTRMVADGV